MAVQFSFRVDVIPPKDNAHRSGTAQLEDPCAQFLVPSDPTESFEIVWAKALSYWKEAYSFSLTRTVRLSKLTTHDNYDISRKRTVGEYGYSAATPDDKRRLRILTQWMPATPVSNSSPTSYKRFATDLDDFSNKRRRLSQHSNDPFATIRHISPIPSRETAASVEPPVRRQSSQTTNFEDWIAGEDGFRRPPKRAQTAAPSAVHSLPSAAKPTNVVEDTVLTIPDDDVFIPDSQPEPRLSSQPESDANSTQIVQDSQPTKAAAKIAPLTPMSIETPPGNAPLVPVSTAQPSEPSSEADVPPLTGSIIADVSESGEQLDDVIIIAKPPTAPAARVNRPAQTTKPAATPSAANDEAKPAESTKWSEQEDALMLQWTDQGVSAAGIVARLKNECGETRTASSVRARRSIVKRKMKNGATRPLSSSSPLAHFGALPTTNSQEIDDSCEIIAVASAPKALSSRKITSSAKAGPSSQAQQTATLTQSRLMFARSSQLSQEIIIGSSPEDDIQQEPSRPRDKGKNAAVGRSVSYDKTQAPRPHFLPQKTAQLSSNDNASSDPAPQPKQAASGNKSVPSFTAINAPAPITIDSDNSGDEFGTDSSDEQAFIAISQSSAIKALEKSSASDISTTKINVPDDVQNANVDSTKIDIPTVAEPVTETIFHVAPASPPAQETSTLDMLPDEPASCPVEIMAGGCSHGEVSRVAAEDDVELELPDQNSWHEDHDVESWSPLVRVDRDKPSDKTSKIATARKEASQPAAGISQRRQATPPIQALSSIMAVDDAGAASIAADGQIADPSPPTDEERQPARFWDQTYKTFSEVAARRKAKRARGRESKKRAKAAARIAAQETSTNSTARQTTNVSDDSSVASFATALTTPLTGRVESTTALKENVVQQAARPITPPPSIAASEKSFKRLTDVPTTQHTSQMPPSKSSLKRSALQKPSSKKRRRSTEVPVALPGTTTDSMDEESRKMSYYGRIKKAAQKPHIPSPPRGYTAPAQATRSIGNSFWDDDSSDADAGSD